MATPNPVVEPLSGRQLRAAVFSDAARNRNGVGSYYEDLSEHLGDLLGTLQLLAPDHSHQGELVGISWPLPGDATQRICLPRVRAISARIGAIAPHLIVVATPGPFGLLGAAIARRRRLPLIVGFHTRYEALVDIYWSWLSRRVSAHYLETINTLLFRAADVVLVNSTEMAEVAGTLGARTVQMVGTPIPRAFIERAARPRSEIRRVLYAGRLAPEKNIHAVLDAAAALPDLEFEIGGDGPLRELVEARARDLDNLTVLGWLSRDQVADALDRADMLVLPSKVESFGTIALEAMARGALVLVSSSCGIVRWPSLAKAVFTIQDNETVAGAISRIAQVDPRLRSEKCRQGRIAAKELNDSTISGWLEVCTGVCHPEPFVASAAAW